MVVSVFCVGLGCRLDFLHQAGNAQNCFSLFSCDANDLVSFCLEKAKIDSLLNVLGELHKLRGGSGIGGGFGQSSRLFGLLDLSIL